MRRSIASLLVSDTRPFSGSEVHPQIAFVPFRFQGQTIARIAKLAGLPAVSRSNCATQYRELYCERYTTFL